MMCVSPYPGDYFSFDALRRRDVNAYARRRPFFVQRLLQMQVASTYFYTALYKITASGNWLTDNPIYYLMNYPPEGVTKFFWGREFWAGHPQLCYAAGLLIVCCELAMPFLLFCRRTRISGIYLGFIFHIVLLLTFDVPAIFFFLFPAQLLLFINPEKILAWIEQKRRENRQSPRPKLVYDGNCHFCRESLKTLQIMDLYETLELVNYQNCDKMETIHPALTRSRAHSQLHLVEPDGSLHGGFFVFRRLAFLLPMMYVLLPVLYFPGMGVIGPIKYRWIANNRYLFHRRKDCRDNACFIKPHDPHDKQS
jgi:predicted DCC family thiol-disulfide oxidoreductase YuxK